MITECETKPDFIRLSEKYAGLWVAVHPDTHEVIASGATATEVYDRAVQGGVEEPLIISVQEDYSSYIPCALG